MLFDRVLINIIMYQRAHWDQEEYHEPVTLIVLKQINQNTNTMVKLKKQNNEYQNMNFQIQVIIKTKNMYNFYIKLFDVQRYNQEQFAKQFGSIDQLLENLEASVCQVVEQHKKKYLVTKNQKTLSMLKIQLKQCQLSNFDKIQFDFENEKIRRFLDKQQSKKQVQQLNGKITKLLQKFAILDESIVDKNTVNDKLSNLQARMIAKIQKSKQDIRQVHQQQFVKLSKQIESISLYCTNKAQQQISASSKQMLAEINSVQDRVATDFDVALANTIKQMQSTMHHIQKKLHHEMQQLLLVDNEQFINKKYEQLKVNMLAPHALSFTFKHKYIQFSDDKVKTGRQLIITHPLINLPAGQFIINILQSKNCYIFIGLLHIKYKDDFNSFWQNREQSILLYGHSGKIYQSGVQLPNNIGSVLKQGDSIKIQTIQKLNELIFTVNDGLPYHHKSPILDKYQRQLAPCIIMYEKKDRISISLNDRQ